MLTAVSINTPSAASRHLPRRALRLFMRCVPILSSYSSELARPLPMTLWKIALATPSLSLTMPARAAMTYSRTTE